MENVDNADEIGATRPTRARFIAESLGEMIDTGEIRPGTKLKEEALAQQFGVSRGPIREALGILARDNLVNIRPHLGAFVPELSQDEIVDLYDVRMALFSMAVRLLTQRVHSGEIRDETLSKLRDRFDSMVAANDESVAAFARQTQGLSRYILDHCDNAKLREELTRINRQSYLHYVELSHTDPAHRRLFIRLSLMLRDAILMGEVTLAADIASRVVDENKSAIIEQFRLMARAAVPNKSEA